MAALSRSFWRISSNPSTTILAVGQARTSDRQDTFATLPVAPGSSDHGSPITNHRELYGLGRGVGRPLGVGTALGVGVGRGVGVAVALGVAVGVGVAVAVAVGVGVAVGVAVGVGVGEGPCPPGNTRT
jgi:hypothetical protein